MSSIAPHPDVQQVIPPRKKDLGDGFVVGRVLPFPNRRRVGPFVFLDHMGPAKLPPGSALDVRPHPHIGLATVTYLFEGEIVHKDSLGSDRTITPGAINWMTAGRGIVHSERQSAEERARGPRVHGVQMWIALPRELEEIDPEFIHYPAANIPRKQEEGISLEVLLGEAYGLASPVKTHSPTFYVNVRLEKDRSLIVPDAYEERGLLLLSGSVRVGDRVYDTPGLLVLTEGRSIEVHSLDETHLMFFGGAALDGDRHMYWNFVSSRPERIEQAKRDWREGRFPLVPGDTEEFIPLPED